MKKKKRIDKKVYVFLIIYILIILIVVYEGIVINKKNNNKEHQTEINDYDIRYFTNDSNLPEIDDDLQTLAINCHPKSKAWNYLTEEIQWAVAECELVTSPSFAKQVDFYKATFSYDIKGDIVKVEFYNHKCPQCIEYDDNRVYINSDDDKYVVYEDNSKHYVIAQFLIIINFNYKSDKIIIDIDDIELSNDNHSYKFDKIEKIVDISKEPYKKKSQ